MRVLLICPQCREKLPLPSQCCPVCGADLHNLPPAERRYYCGEAEKVRTAPASLAVEASRPPRAAGLALGDFPEPRLADPELTANKQVSLCEALDRILHKGAVLSGEVMISVADIDLIYLGLQVVLASTETLRKQNPAPAGGRTKPNIFEERASS